MEPESVGAAREMLRRFPLIDGHNDFPWAVRRICRYDLSEFDLVDTAGRTQTDLTRLSAGGVGAQFWSVYVPSNLPGDTAVTATLESSRPRPGTTVDQVVDHLEHAREVAGLEHIGIGSDYDGYSTFPEGLGDVAAYPTLFAAMLGRGWSEQECALVAGANVLRVMRAAEAVAADRAGERPGTATMEDPR